MKIIEIINLKKIYHNFIMDIDQYQFHKGKGYLLIGENGSGKTTLIKLILSFIKPTIGKINLYTNSVGFAPEHFLLPPFLTISSFLDNIALIRKKNNQKLISELIVSWELDARKKMAFLSKGMKQKVNILQSLIHDPELYIFDEPFNGLDKKSQNVFIDLVKKLQKEKKTIIITTHYEKYFEKLNFYTIIIEDGKLYEKIN